MQKILYVLTGKANCGKTHTVKYIYAELKKNYAGKTNVCYKNARVRTEVHEAMEFDCSKIGASSAGDDAKTIKNRLKNPLPSLGVSSQGDEVAAIKIRLLALANCDIVITAARVTKSNKQFQEVQNFAQKYNFLLKDFPLKKKNPIPTNPKDFVDLNVANQIIFEIKSII